MDCHELENVLADYLGDELSASDRAACDEHLGRCLPCRTRVGASQRVLDDLRRLETVSVTDATDRTAKLRLHGRPAPARRVLLGLLKAAAVLAIGIGIGRYTVATASTASDAGALAEHTTVMAEAVPAAVHPGWVELGRQTAPAGSSFSQHLAMLARTVRR